MIAKSYIAFLSVMTAFALVLTSLAVLMVFAMIPMY